VCSGNVHSNRIDVTRKDMLRTQKARRHRQDSRTCSDVENNLSRLNPPFQSFHHELRRFMGSCSESLSRINSDRQAVLWAGGPFPTGNHEKTVGNWKTRIGLLPFLGPVALFDKSARYHRSRFFNPAKNRVHDFFDILDSFEIGSVVEVTNE